MVATRISIVVAARVATVSIVVGTRVATRSSILIVIGITIRN